MVDLRGPDGRPLAPGNVKAFPFSIEFKKETPGGTFQMGRITFYADGSLSGDVDVLKDWLAQAPANMDTPSRVMLWCVQAFISTSTKVDEVHPSELAS